MQPVSRRLPLFIFLVVTLILRLSMPPLAAQTQSPPLGEALQNAAKAVQKALQQK
jgi:hypothetical protein